MLAWLLGPSSHSLITAFGGPAASFDLFAVYFIAPVFWQGQYQGRGPGAQRRCLWSSTPCPVRAVSAPTAWCWQMQGLSHNTITHSQICLEKYPKKATVPNTPVTSFSKAGGFCQLLFAPAFLCVPLLDSLLLAGLVRGRTKEP